MYERIKRPNDLSKKNDDINSCFIIIEETTCIIPYDLANDYNKFLVELSEQKAKVHHIQCNLRFSRYISELRECIDRSRDSKLEYQRNGREIQNDLSSKYEQCKKLLEGVEIENAKLKLKNAILDKKLKLNIVL